jgi:RNA modification enzyme, MiaB family
VITGCYAQLKPQEISSIQGVNMVVGTGEKYNIVQHVNALEQGHSSKIHSCDIEDVMHFHTSYSALDRTRTFLKVQDGCDYNCTFCTIPLARGHSRSDSIEGVLQNIHELEQIGVKEVVLTGVNLGDFGKGYEGGKRKQESFLELIKAIDTSTTIPRFRISSIEPNLLTDEIIQFVSTSNRFMPHFHIPLQSGNDTLLAAMRRRYRRALYADRVNHIKSLMPHACIGVDVIVGFPGETDEAFQVTVDFLSELDISYLHVFTYSERENTLAASMDGVVPYEKRKHRNAVLRMLSEKKMTAFKNNFINTIRPVLFEKEEKQENMQGYTDNYIKVCRPYDASQVNTIVDVLL